METRSGQILSLSPLQVHSPLFLQLKPTISHPSRTITCYNFQSIFSSRRLNTRKERTTTFYHSCLTHHLNRLGPHEPVALDIKPNFLKKPTLRSQDHLLCDLCLFRWHHFVPCVRSKLYSIPSSTHHEQIARTSVLLVEGRWSRSHTASVSRAGWR